MKRLGLKMFSLLLLIVAGAAVQGQERDAEVPGDYFSLEGALELFKKSASPEEFEKMLNAENSKINNLDLNGDGYTDYLRVIDRNEANIHTFTIQAVISDNEVQDVAVIELEKLANGKAVLQITGDEDVYGMETIIEPTEEVRVNAGATTTQTVVNVWTWPAVQYVYDPYYTVWVSPWGWYSRPVWWHVWRPVGYYNYYSWWQPYRPYYTRCYTHRVVYAHRIYSPYRTTSVMVRSRHRAELDNYRTAHRGDVHRNDATRSRYTADRSRDRNDYRTDRTNISQTRARNGNDRSETSVDTHRPVTRQRTEQQASENRDRPTMNRPAERNREAVPSHRQNPVQRTERSERSINHGGGSSQQHSQPVMHQQRSRPSGGGGTSGGSHSSRSSQSHSRRSR